MRRSTWILVGLNVMLWGSLAAFGVRLMQGVRAQHAAGYPNAGQIANYVGVPAAVAAACVLWGLWLWRRKPRRHGEPLLVAALCLLLPYLLVYSGGM